MNQPNEIDLVQMFNGLNPQDVRVLRARIAAAVQTAYQDFTREKTAQKANRKGKKQKPLPRMEPTKDKLNYDNA